MVEPSYMTEEEYEELCESSSGICLACREIQYGGCEPDAEGYECGMCGEHRVQGIENALIAGNIAFTCTR